MLPKHGHTLKDMPTINHQLLDEICPPTFEEMREKEGIGSDNMTIICVDLLQNNGGSNGATGTSTSIPVSKSTRSSGLGEPKAAGLSSSKLGKMRKH